ncbi:MAG: MBL fold metallo-hydrolase [Thermodesulfobacteriota bacterium]
MRITCYGSRGSIAVSGPEYLRYGGDTTCLEIRTKEDDVIIVDAGTGLRRLGNMMKKEGKSSFDFLFTHAHWDHLMGFPFFKPLFDPNARVRMEGCPFARKYVEKLIARVMAPPNFPILPSAIQARIEYQDSCPTLFSIGPVQVMPVPLSHPNRGAGYKFVEDGKTFVFLTDNELDFLHPGGLPFEDYAEFCRGADLLIHDAEFTPKEYQEVTRGWGHSQFTRAVELGLAAGVKKLGMFHLNQDHSDDQIDAMEAEAKSIIAGRGSDMECVSVACGMVFEL